MSSSSSPRPSAPRLFPITQPVGEVKELLSRGIDAPDGTPLNIFATLAHHPAVLKRFLNFGVFPEQGSVTRERTRNSHSSCRLEMSIGV